MENSSAQHNKDSASAPCDLGRQSGGRISSRLLEGLQPGKSPDAAISARGLTRRLGRTPAVRDTQSGMTFLRRRGLARGTGRRVYQKMRGGRS